MPKNLSSRSTSIKSMTGYAQVSRELSAGNLALELRSVNHRYLDLQIKLPEEFRLLEPALREALSRELVRGKVDCRLSFNAAITDRARLAIDEALVRRLGELAREVHTLVPNAAALTTAEILRWPGVLAEPEFSAEEVQAAALALAETALADLTASRSREGAKLADVLFNHCVEIDRLVEKVEPRLPAIRIAYHEKLLQRFREAVTSLDEERIRQEVTLFATRIDVAEEVARLRTHTAEVRRILGAGGQVGKRLDFLMQELNREANTLASKSVDTELTQVALDLKVAIEQMREQIQNLE